jgi:hypothetical protein
MQRSRGSGAQESAAACETNAKPAVSRDDRL